MASTMGDIREEERPLFGKLRRELLQSYAEKGKLELITTANVAWAWK